MIRKTLIAAAALTTGFAATAEARIAANGNVWNGVSLNSVKFNGSSENSMRINGAGENGVKLNSRTFNSTAAQSFAPALESVILPSGVILLAR